MSIESDTKNFVGKFFPKSKILQQHRLQKIVGCVFVRGFQEKSILGVKLCLENYKKIEAPKNDEKNQNSKNATELRWPKFLDKVLRFNASHKSKNFPQRDVFQIVKIGFRKFIHFGFFPILTFQAISEMLFFQT